MEETREQKQEDAQRYQTNLLTQKDKTAADIADAKARVDANEK